MSGGTPPRRRAVGCPSDLALDELRAGDLAGDPGEAALRQHVQSCAACGARLAAVDALAVPPPSLQLRAEVTAGARRRARSVRVIAAGGAAAAAAVLLLALTRAQLRPHPARDDQQDRAKGGLALSVHVKRASGGVDHVAGEGELAPGDELRFEVQAAQAGRALVVGLDAAPSATIYVPAAGDAVAIDGTGPTVLPGSIVADARAGAERVFAVLCPEARPLAPAALRALAEVALAQAGGRPEVVSSLGSACAEASVLFQKKPTRPGSGPGTGPGSGP